MANAGPTRAIQVVSGIRDRIERRTLTPGARLPSVRSMAATSGFSKSTVVEAYDRLVAEGLIRPRQGSGFFVAARSPLGRWIAAGRTWRVTGTRSGCCGNRCPLAPER